MTDHTKCNKPRSWKVFCGRCGEAIEVSVPVEDRQLDGQENGIKLSGAMTDQTREREALIKELKQKCQSLDKTLTCMDCCLNIEEIAEFIIQDRQRIIKDFNDLFNKLQNAGLTAKGGA